LLFEHRVDRRLGAFLAVGLDTPIEAITSPSSTIGNAPGKPPVDDARCSAQTTPTRVQIVAP
jgi:hypothetical protein